MSVKKPLILIKEPIIKHNHIINLNKAIILMLDHKLALNALVAFLNELMKDKFSLARIIILKLKTKR